MMKALELPAALSMQPQAKSHVSVKALERWNPAMTVQASGKDAGTISILDPIGENFFGDGVSAKRIDAALRNIGDRDVVVSINSPGGDFFEGLAIYNMLAEHSGHVTVKVLGLAASAASLIAMAGDTIQIARAGFFMIHNTHVLAAGDRNALRLTADWLEPFDGVCADIFNARTGIAANKLSGMLDAETWIGGAEAVSGGFADGLLDEAEVAGQAKNDTNARVFAAKKKLDAMLASGGMTRSQRRDLFASLNEGTPRAAPDGKPRAANPGTPRAAIHELAQNALAKLETL